MILSLFKKEFKLISRSLHGVISMLVLGFCILFLFHFSLERDSALDLSSLVGIKWAIIFMTSFVLIGQSTWEERDMGAGTVIHLFVSPWIVFVVKSATLWILLVCTEIVILLGMVLFFQNMLLDDFIFHFSILPFSTMSLSFLGVSLSGFSSSSRMKEVVLPLLLVPFSVPLFLYGLNAEFRYLTDPGSWGNSFFLMVFFCFFYGGLGALFQEMQSEDMDG